MSLDYTELNSIARCALGPTAWAESVYAAVCCNAPDEMIQESIRTASDDERQALAKLLTEDSALMKMMKSTEMISFSGGECIR